MTSPQPEPAPDAPERAELLDDVPTTRAPDLDSLADTPTPVAPTVVPEPAAPRLLPVEISLGVAYNSENRVLVDGKDIAASVSELYFEADANRYASNRFPTLHLKLVPRDTVVRAIAGVTVIPAAGDVLDWLDGLDVNEVRAHALDEVALSGIGGRDLVDAVLSVLRRRATAELAPEPAAEPGPDGAADQDRA